MKDSQFVIAEELYKKVTDGTHDSPKPQAAGFPLVTSKNIKGGILDISTANLISKEDYDNINKRSKVEKWDVIISMIGEYCGYTYIEKSSEINYAVKNVGLFKTGSKLEANWLTYYLQSDYGKYYLQQVKSGSSQPYLSLGALRKLPILNPSKEIKQGIVNILSALDDKIELNNRINDELEQMAKTLYDYWFVQFDFPDTQGMPYKASGGKMVYNDVLKKMIPDGWTNGLLVDLMSLEYGKPLKESDRSGSGYPVLGSNGIVGYHKDFLMQGPGIVVGRKGSAGEITWIDSNFFPIDTTYYVTSKIKSKSLIYHYYLLRRTNLKKVESSSAVPGLNRNVVHSFKMEIPPTKIIEAFHNVVVPFYDRIANNKNQNQYLSALRDWLLPMLMNGQVKVASGAISTKGNKSKAAEPHTGYIKAIPLTIPANKKGFAKQVLAGKIVSRFIDDPNFTDIKFQKVQFLGEHIGEADLNLNYYSKAAGPYDNKFMYTIYNDFRKQKWYDYKNNRFIPLEKQEKIEGYYQGYFASVQDQLSKLFNLLYPTTEAEAEIIATIYAVWNNRVIKGQSVVDEELINDFYLWSDRKKKYSKREVMDGLQWLRKYQMEPKGFGKLIKRAA